jgi:hypothetical protein
MVNLTRIMVMLTFISTSVSAQRNLVFRLPASAAITIDHSEFDPKDANMSDFCPTWKLTQRQVRRMFSTYHLLQDDDLHDFYSFPDCWIDGTIVFHGKTFHWQARPGNTLSTDWPDGKTRMLGGKHSENPADY